MRIASAVRHPHAIATACFTVLALALTGPSLIGRAALGPDSLLDWDPLYRSATPAPLPIFNDYTPIATDLPKDLRIARGLHAGRFDDWNPLSACGVPLWAEESGPFFPLKLPFYLVPSRATYHLFLTLRLIFAALGAYLLARQRGLGPTPAIAAGAAFELSGTMVAQLPFGVFSPSYVLPWVILGSFAIAQRRTAAAAAGTGVALGLAAHGGHPTVILLVFAGFAAAVAGHMIAAWRRPRVVLAIAACAAGAAILGLALAAPVLLPLAEMANVGSSYKNRPVGTMVWHWLLQQSRTTLPIALFAPGTFQALYPSLQTVFGFAPSIGVLGLIVAIAGVCTAGLDAALVTLALLGVGLATMPPGLMWLHRIPGLALIIPTYAWSLVVLTLTQAAGSGVRVLSARSGWRVGVLAFMLFAASALATLLFAKAYLPAVANLLDQAFDGTAQLARRALPLPVVSAVALGACFALQRTRLAWLCAPGLTVAIALEQLVTMAPFTRQQASAVLSSEPSPAVQFLQRALADGNSRMTAVPYRLGYPITTMLFELPDLRGVSALPVDRLYDYLHALSAKAGAFTIQEASVTSSPLLDLAAVRYVVLAVQSGDVRAAVKAYAAEKLGESGAGTAALPADLAGALLLMPPAWPAADDANMTVAYQDERVFIYENRAALPRVRIVHTALAVPDRRTALQRINDIGRLTEHARPLGLDSAVVVEPDENGNPPPPLSGASAETESVRIIDDSDPDALALEARLDQPGLVVIADTYYPGWEAWVDEKPSSIYPANLAFRAVYIPAGVHRVVLRYRQRWFHYGLLAAAAAAFTCTAVLVQSRRATASPPS